MRVMERMWLRHASAPSFPLSTLSTPQGRTFCGFCSSHLSSMLMKQGLRAALRSLLTASAPPMWRSTCSTIV